MSDKWPDLIWSFPDFSDSAKQAVCLRQQGRDFMFLFGHRAIETCALTKFHKCFSSKAKGLGRIKTYVAAAFPGKVANLIVVFLPSVQSIGRLAWHYLIFCVAVMRLWQAGHLHVPLG